jgi:hypothetical protein
MQTAQQALVVEEARGHERRFVIAQNPDAESSLPYLLRIPAGRELVLKAAQPWPISTRVYCHAYDEPFPAAAEVLAEVGVRMCAWRGNALDLVLDRHRHNRSQFVFTRARGRPAIFWQTPLVTRSARPRVRVPVSARAAGTLSVEVDQREKRPYAFAGRAVETVRTTLFAGDYAVRTGSGLAAAVERKTVGDAVRCLVNGSLMFAGADLSSLAAAAIVIEGRYSDLLTYPRVNTALMADRVARMQVRYPSVPLIFAENRKLAEEWTFRFLASAMAEYG